MTGASAAPRLTVAVATRNRPDGLIRCIQSLRRLAPESIEILIVDDCSDEPIESKVREAIGSDFPWPIRVIRHAINTGYIPSRNEMVREATAPFVLLIDDDAELIDDRVYKALVVLETDPSVGAVALGQAAADGQPYPDFMQPATATGPCQVASFSGYGHLVRSDLFLSVGGYSEIFWYYGEEQEFCKRLLDRGSKVIYLPDVRVGHYFSPIGRDERSRYRYGMRNSCYDAVLNEPLPLPLVSIPVRFYRYARYSKIATKAHNFSDQGSLRWVASELLRDLSKLIRRRQALKWSTYSTWKRLKQQRLHYAMLTSTELAQAGT